jgi:hypothetical protein
MIGRLLWRRGGSYYVPRWEIMAWRGWTYWMVGADVERHPGEWMLTVRLGPFGLSLHHVR